MQYVYLRVELILVLVVVLVAFCSETNHAANGPQLTKGSRVASPITHLKRFSELIHQSGHHQRPRVRRSVNDTDSLPRKRSLGFDMSAKHESSKSAASKKKFGKKGEREIPHHTQKAKKWYPAEDESVHKKVGRCSVSLAKLNRWRGVFWCLDGLVGEGGCWRSI